MSNSPLSIAAYPDLNDVAHAAPDPAEHTSGKVYALSWEEKYPHIENDVIPYYFVGAGDGFFDRHGTERRGFELSGILSRADAHRLRDCWNSHDTLLKALEYARNHVVNPELTDVRDLLATLNAAIAAAKGAA